MMRGGESLAIGVSEAVPAKEFHNVDAKNFEGKRTVILVHSVVNTGSSIVDFVEPLREKYPHVRVIVVAGVVQAKALVIQTEPEANNRFAEWMRDDRELYVVA
jgi:uracil phosphoribosyltransferase